MKYFDLQFGHIPKSEQSQELLPVGFFANKFLVLQNSYDATWYKRHHTVTVLFKSLFLLSLFLFFLLGAVLVADIAQSDFGLIRYFTLFSEHSAPLRQLYILLCIDVLCVLALSYHLFFKSKLKYHQLGVYKETVFPTNKTNVLDIPPSLKVDLWESVDDDARRVVLMSLDCAHFWRHGSLSGVHFLKCLALYCGHAQHVFLRFGIDVDEFVKHLHDEMSRTAPGLDWDSTYLHLILSRAYKISVESGERAISSLSLFDALIAHDASVREMFDGMGINYQDVVSLIELERVHVLHEQFSWFVKVFHGLPHSFTALTVPINTLREIITTQTLSPVACYTTNSSYLQKDIEFLLMHISILQGHEFARRFINLDALVERFGLIKSFVRVRKLLDSYFTSKIIFISDAVYSPLITIDDSREYSLVSYLHDISKHIESKVVLLAKITDQSTLTTMYNHEIPVVDVFVDDRIQKLLIVMEQLRGLESQRRLLLSYDALLMIAFELTPQFLQSISSLLSVLPKGEKRLVVTSQMIKHLLSA